MSRIPGNRTVKKTLTGVGWAGIRRGDYIRLEKFPGIATADYRVIVVRDASTLTVREAHRWRWVESIRSSWENASWWLDDQKALIRARD